MTGQGTERRHRREHDDAVFRRDLHVATPKRPGYISRQALRYASRDLAAKEAARVKHGSRRNWRAFL